MNPPFFSVIIPTFNRKEFLQKAIQSTLDQTFSDFELIIIDDGSTDQTEDMVRGFKDERIVYQYQDNHGVAHARNRGIEKAKTEWFVFCDSDDWFKENKLELTKNYIDANPSVPIFHTEEIWYKNGQVLEQKEKHKKPNGWVYFDAVKMCCISISTASIHKNIFETIGLFDESFSACEDYDFWLRATQQFRVKLIPEYLTEKEGGRDDQLSAQPGLDYYRVKALAKMLASGRIIDDEYSETLKEMIQKGDVYLKGAHKRGKQEEIDELTAQIQQFDPSYSFSV